MKIGELATATGVDTQTLRYYERIGLLPPPLREANGYRIYPEQALERVGFIRHCRDLDMSLAEIERILALSETPEADCGDINQILDTHLAQLHAKQVALARLEQQLLTLRARCDAHRRAADCGILQDLLSAGGCRQLAYLHLTALSRVVGFRSKIILAS